ncbi:MAG: hypothetical protein AAF479_08725 [Pseudomonadota bacterium]
MTTVAQILAEQTNRTDYDRSVEFTFRVRSKAEEKALCEWMADNVRSALPKPPPDRSKPVPGGGKGMING